MIRQANLGFYDNTNTSGRVATIARPHALANGSLRNRCIAPDEQSATIKQLDADVASFRSLGKGDFTLDGKGIRVTQNPAGKYDLFRHPETGVHVALMQRTPKSSITIHTLADAISDRVTSIWSGTETKEALETLAEKLRGIK